MLRTGCGQKGRGVRQSSWRQHGQRGNFVVMANKDEHRALVDLGARYAKGTLKFSVVASEIRAYGPDEEADVIAFRSHVSLLIEAKCSRSDFFADRRKPARSVGGLGTYRFYLCPAGLITIDDLPARWGLLWVEDGKVRMVKGPTGNLWPPYDPTRQDGDWSDFMHEPDLKAEHAVLFSIARRRSPSRSEERYEKQLREAKLRADRFARSNDALAEEVRDLSLKLFLAERGHTDEPAELRAAIRRKVKKTNDSVGQG